MLTDVCVVIDINHRICLFNGGAESAFGYLAAEVMGQPLSLLLPEEEQAIDSLPSQSVTVSAEGQSFASVRQGIYGRRKDGTVFLSDASIGRFEQERGEFFVVLLRNSQTVEHAAGPWAVHDEIMFHQLAENSQEVFFVRDLVQNRMIYVNSAYEQVWGQPRDTLLNDPRAFLESAHPGDRQRVITALEKQNHGEGYFNEEYRIVRPDGELRWIWARTFPIQDERGKVYRVAGLAEDITQRKYLADSLQHERDLAQSLVNTAQVVILALDLHGRIVSFNPYMEVLSGYRLAEVQGKDWFETFLPPCDRERVYDLFSKAVAGTQTRGNINPIVAKDGSEHFVEWHDSLLKDTDGNITGLLAIGKDVTGQQQAEDEIRILNAELEQRVRTRTAELEAANRQLRDEIKERTWVERELESNRRFIERIANTAPNYIYVIDIIAGRYRYANDAMGSLLGCAKERLLEIDGMAYVDSRIAPDDLPKINDRLKTIINHLNIHPEILTRDVVYEFEYQVLNAASEWRWIHAWIVVFATTSDLKVSQILGVAHDITGRKQAENTVRWAEDRYRRLFEEAPLMYINLQDQAGIPIITECNQAFLYALGYTFAEVLGHPVSDFYAPESRVALLESGGYRRALERHFTAEERTLVTHDGRVIYTMLTAVPETDMQGNVIGTRAMYVDITERKQVEENLRRSESSLAEAQRLSQLGSWDWNLRTNAISCSEEMCRLVGRTPSEIDLTPEAFAKFLPPNEAERVLLKFESVPADQPFFSIEHRLIRSNGELRAAVSQVKVYRDENGTPLRLLGSTQDITARHLAELSLRKLSSALEQTADLVLITDRNGLIEYVNPAFEQLTGYSLAEVIGQTPRIIKSGRMSAKFHESLWNTLLAGQIYRGELVNKKKNGELYYEEKTITPIRDSESTITHFISTGKDVTERKRVQAQIQRYTNQLEALNQLAQITVTSLDQETVLNNIATAIQSLMRCQQAYVLIPDGADLVIAAVAGGNDKLRGFHIPIATSIAGRVYTMGESIQSSVDKASEREAVFQELDKLRSFRGRSVVAAPIQIGQRVAGVLEAVHSTRDAYDEDDRRLLDAASNWAAIAIENARQHGVTLRRWRESDALVRISRALNETMHLPRVLQMIADAAQQIIPTVEHTVIHLLDGEQNALRSMAVAGLHQLRREEFTMRSGEGAAGLAIAQQMVVNIRDTRSDPRYLPIGNAVHLKSLLVAPIQIAARPLGTISVQSVIIGAFSADDERLLEAFASNAAIAIENARLFEMERRQRDEAITLQWIAQAINSRLDLPGLLQAAAAALSEMANYDQVVVVFLEPEGWRVMARQSIDTETLPDFIPADSVREYGAAHSGQAGLVPSLLAEPVWARLMPGMQALVHAPIWMQNRVKGFVAVGAREQHSLGDRDVELLAGVGRQLGVAIENVMLYSDLSFSLEQEHDMRAQLIQAAKLGALGRLTASLAHEINNPLQSIQGCLTLAIEELETHKRSEKISRYLGVAEGEIGRISAIVRNMRDFYRPAGSDFKPTDIHLILQGVLELTNKQLQQGLIKFRRIWTEDLPMIEAVPDHLRQVFLNLVLNAVDGMPEGGMLTISSTVSQIKYSGQQGSIPAIQVEVADTGRGMSADTLSHLFEPFFTTKEQGSGLGLSISYRIVQAHSGFISAASEEGHGSVFTVLLPISQTLKLSETANE